MARGFVRILAPYSRTLLFQDRVSFHGVAAEAAEELENYIRRTYPALKQKFVVVLIPTSRDRLLSDLLAGLGDIAAGDITITPDRQKVVSFTTPPYSGIKELVVTAAGAPPLSSAEDLSGKEIAARPTTSTYASLVALNERLAGAGRPKATIIELPPVLEVEDMMEMVAAGLLLPAIPAEDWVADLWLPLVPGLQVHHNAVLRSGAEVGWAVRPASPERCSFPVKWFFSVYHQFFVRSGKRVLRPVACDQVPGARGRGQGTETLAKLGGLPPSGACVSQRPLFKPGAGFDA